MTSNDPVVRLVRQAERNARIRGIDTRTALQNMHTLALLRQSPAPIVQLCEQALAYEAAHTSTQQTGIEL